MQKRLPWLPSRMLRPSIPYSLRMLWRDRRRFLPALLAIGLSAVLIAVQCGLVMGLVRTTSAPIDHSFRRRLGVAPGRPEPASDVRFPARLAVPARPATGDRALRELS